jgi:hypothetical protein
VAPSSTSGAEGRSGDDRCLEEKLQLPPPRGDRTTATSVVLLVCCDYSLRPRTSLRSWIACECVREIRPKKKPTRPWDSHCQVYHEGTEAMWTRSKTKETLDRDT